jgi:phospholipase/carboxylesterase
VPLVPERRQLAVRRDFFSSTTSNPLMKSCLTLLLLACISCSAADKSAPRITARPATPAESCIAGLQPLGLEQGRDGQLFVPASAATRKKLSLIVFLHGAGHDSNEALTALREESEKEGFLLLAPDSRGISWDAIRGSFGPDVQFLNRALERVFHRCAVDPHHITLAGFSDGATYALSLGLANADLFSHIIAFSPGFIVPAQQRGMAFIFITHGRNDQILPIDQTSRVIVRNLETAGYNVSYHEFDGPHAMSRKLISEAVRWAR